MYRISSLRNPRRHVTRVTSRTFVCRLSACTKLRYDTPTTLSTRIRRSLKVHSRAPKTVSPNSLCGSSQMWTALRIRNWFSPGLYGGSEYTLPNREPALAKFLPSQAHTRLHHPSPALLPSCGDRFFPWELLPGSLHPIGGWLLGPSPALSEVCRQSVALLVDLAWLVLRCESVKAPSPKPEAFPGQAIQQVTIS